MWPLMDPVGALLWDMKKMFAIAQLLERQLIVRACPVLVVGALGQRAGDDSYTGKSVALMVTSSCF